MDNIPLYSLINKCRKANNGKYISRGRLFYYLVSSTHYRNYIIYYMVFSTVLIPAFFFVLVGFSLNYTLVCVFTDGVSLLCTVCPFPMHFTSTNFGLLRTPTSTNLRKVMVMVAILLHTGTLARHR